MLRAAGIVLCGGQSKRMGQSKAGLPFGGQTMLARVAERVGVAVSPVVVVCAQHQVLTEIPAGVQVVRDQLPNHGPVAGLAAGLAALEPSCEAAFLASCDLPLLVPGLILRLLELIGENQICIPYVGNRYHPLSAVYTRVVTDTVRNQLSNGRLRLLDLMDLLPTRVVSETELRDVDPEFGSFLNMNTPEEYKKALRIAGVGEYRR
jgi:molybdenum cofactor guanylyltransferase